MRTGNVTVTVIDAVNVAGLILVIGLIILGLTGPSQAESSAPAMDRIARELEMMNRNLTQGNVKCVCECKTQ